MSEAFILKNQHDQFLDKHNEWVDQADTGVLYRTIHKDEAINMMVELSVKNADMRLRVVACTLGDRGKLTLKPEDAAPRAAANGSEAPANTPCPTPALFTSR